MTNSDHTKPSRSQISVRWDHVSLEREKKAKEARYRAQWTVEDAVSTLDEYLHELSLTPRQRFLGPWITFSVFVLADLGLVTGGILSGDTGFYGGAVLAAFFWVLALVAVWERRRDARDAPHYVFSAARRLARADEDLDEANRHLQHVRDAAQEKAEKALRYEALQERLLQVSEYVDDAAATVHSADTSADDAWAKLAEERGWSDDMLSLMRGAEEAAIAARA